MRGHRPGRPGSQGAEIAVHLVVGPRTATTRVKRAMIRIGARDRARLVVLADESGPVEPRSWGGGSPAPGR
ncbi:MULTISPECIES: hypothetical protein [unclassified Streptomyces]|uniref:hypothetical protein n=1 Tax=unclassified Streptomyces TaxID=2593676 RepID=UPI0015BD53F5|nr:hypothetical protein [Streptomyces sp. NBRC 110465]